MVPGNEKLASKGSIFCGGFKMFHVHILLVAPLETGNMTQSHTNKHQSEVTVREHANYPCPATNLAVKTFNHIVCANARPAFGGKIGIGWMDSR